MRTLRRFSLWLITCSILGAAAPALAQGGRAEINGTVLDAQKAVLPGATITATNEDTGLTREAVTDSAGRYVIPQLLPGTYTVKAELSGFQPTVRSGMAVRVGEELTVTLTLPLAGEIDSSPSANRSQFSLMQTIPGLVPVLQPGSFEGGQFSANGQATTSNLFIVDGQNDNDSRRGGSQGTQARVSLDSMAEYQVQTHQYGAEYGGSTGVVVNSVTRSGTNNFAGRVFEYYQDDKLASTDYFLKQAGESNDDFGSNVYGGSIGGPIVKNKAFFFFNYEGTKAREAANLNFPAQAAPLAVSYSTNTAFSGPNTFLRLDYHLSANSQLGFRWTREKILKIHLEKKGFTTEVPYDELGRLTNGYSGREIERFCKEVTTRMIAEMNEGLPALVDQGLDSVRTYQVKVRELERGEFEGARRRIAPQTTPAEMTRYVNWKESETL